MFIIDRLVSVFHQYAQNPLGQFPGTFLANLHGLQMHDTYLLTYLRTCY